MEVWTEKVADAVRHVPSWNPSWLNEVTLEIPKPKQPDFDTPQLR